MELKEKIKRYFDYKIITTKQNKNMLDFEGYHFKVTIENKETKAKESFNYSVGLGHNPNDKPALFFGLIGCIYSDKNYTDYDEFLGLGYNEDSKKDEKIYDNICKQYKQAEKIGLISFFDSLTEEEQDKLSEGL